MDVLAMSGGGAKGAHSVGAFLEVAEYRAGRGLVPFDAVVGTSVGAVNGLEIAAHASDLEAARALHVQWLELDEPQVARRRFGGPLSLLFAPSLYDMAPLLETMVRRVRPLVRPFRAVAVDLCTGEVGVGTEEMPVEELLAWVMASSAAPIAYSGVETNRPGHWVDGGVRDVSPLATAIRMGATRVTLLLTEAERLTPWERGSDRVWNTGPRAFEIMFRENVEGDLRGARLYNALVRARAAEAVGKREVELTVIRPTAPTPISATGFGEHAAILDVIAIGRRDARRVLLG